MSETSHEHEGLIPPMTKLLYKEDFKPSACDGDTSGWIPVLACLAYMIAGAVFMLTLL